MCVYEAGLLLLFAYIALLLLPLSVVPGVGAPSLSLVGIIIKGFKAVRRGSLSFSLFVVASAACVYETGLLLLFAYVALLLLPLSFFHVVGAPCRRHFPSAIVFSCSTWLIVCCGDLYFGFICANSIFWGRYPYPI